MKKRITQRWSCAVTCTCHGSSHSREIWGSHGSDYKDALCTVMPCSLVKCNNTSEQSTASITRWWQQASLQSAHFYQTAKCQQPKGEYSL